MIESTRLLNAHAFAERAGVTVRTLHHYDRLGLLKPSGRTEGGYRLYGERELARLQQIVTLKVIGLPLRTINDVLDRHEIDVLATLRLQRAMLLEKRGQLDVAIRAIDQAECQLTQGGVPDWGVLLHRIERISMQHDSAWVKRYYTDDQLAKLSAREWNPALQAQVEEDWKTLRTDVEAAIGESPSGEHVQQLADRWSALIEAFTGGDPGIETSLERLHADRANWPADARMPAPMSEAATALIGKALAIHKERLR
jgi:DNA-binding transcriptional MerR regulator